MLHPLTAMSSTRNSFAKLNLDTIVTCKRRHNCSLIARSSRQRLTKSNVLAQLQSQRQLFVGDDIAVTPITRALKRNKRYVTPMASFFGVGAPEALVIGVVALIVFGPRGLAEVARSAGKTLRQFQPTIKELQEVSREFKNTLEQEIGLDELRKPYAPPPPVPPPNTPVIPPTTTTPTESTASTAYPSLDAPVEAPPAPKAYTAEDYARVTEEQAKSLVPEELRKAAELAAWGGAAPVVPGVTTPPAPEKPQSSAPVKDSKEKESK